MGCRVLMSARWWAPCLVGDLAALSWECDTLVPWFWAKPQQIFGPFIPSSIIGELFLCGNEGAFYYYS